MSRSRLPLNSCCNSGAALLGLLLISACTDTGTSTVSSPGLCRADATPISAIQGDGYYSPLQDSLTTTQGTVTRVIQSEGIYIEDGSTPHQASRSRALFVSDQSLSRSAAPGQVLAVSGRVAELGSSRDKLTSLVEISAVETCAENAVLPETPVSLPMNSKTREALEGMRVIFEQPLTVTDVYKLSENELTLSAGGVLRIPTEAARPGSVASRQARENRNRSLVVRLAQASGAPISIGSTFKAPAGIMGHDGRAQQLVMESEPRTQIPEAEMLQAAVEGQVRLVSSNLLNFFNGDGAGGGFPAARGPESMDDFRAQSARIEAAMSRIQPDLLAVQELENDGFGPRSAARSLLALLNNTGNDDWAVVETEAGRIGEDVITVGLFYRRQVLEKVGKPHTLHSREYQGLSRVPLAQLFRDRGSGVEFLVAANHLKSKYGCPEDGFNSDQDDGQGCWNAARVSAVEAQIKWLEQLANRLETGNVLILGDMNAYRMEDPIRQFSDASYVDLVEQRAGLPQYSYVYWGQAGTLDYLFASPAMTRYVRAAQIWHINAGHARNMEHPQPWLRASDHDPVIADFDFSQPETSD
jgi:predicted extracellular nuclease